MSKNSNAFDAWIRTSFVDINTVLEEAYFKQHDKLKVSAGCMDLKQKLRDEGERLIIPLWQEGNTDEGSAAAYNLLGNVGFYMAAMRRHEISLPERDLVSPFTAASGLAMHIGASLGVAPRFATAHLSTSAAANDGRYKSFTHLEDEALFIECNSLGIFGYKQAADALLRIVPLGISHPLAENLFVQAAEGLMAVIKQNDRLFTALNIQRFFCNVRPYYKPYRVDTTLYRGANAGDFAGINIIDLMLGLCAADDPFYAKVLHEKIPFMAPQEQAELKNSLRYRSFLEQFCTCSDEQKHTDWFSKNVAAFLNLCDLHASAAAQHHNHLVERFIVKPSEEMAPEHHEGLTASGPPLSALLASLQRMRDLRTASVSRAEGNRYADFAVLRNLVRQ